MKSQRIAPVAADAMTLTVAPTSIEDTVHQAIRAVLVAQKLAVRRRLLDHKDDLRGRISC
jgi:hypothetical protein